MAITLQKLYQGQAAATAAAIYTATRAMSINHLRAVNTDTSARTLKLWQGASATDATCILPAVSIPAGGWLELGGLYLNNSDALYAQASVASKVTVTVYGVDGTQAVDNPPLVSFHVYDSSGRESAVETVNSLDDVGDVAITSVADNEVLAYDSTSEDWINQTAAEAGLAASDHAHAVGDLSDVTLTNEADGEILVYDTDKFVNKAPLDAGLIPWLGVMLGATDPPTISELEDEWGPAATVGVAFGLAVGPTSPHFVICDGTNWYQAGGSVVDDGDQ